MPRLLAAGATIAAATLTLAVAPSALASTTQTSFGLTGQSLGLRVLGGSLPATSGDVAKVSSSCTSLAGVSADNHAAAVSLPGGFGTIGAMSSTTWTSRTTGNTVNRYSRATIAGVTLDNPTTHTAALKIEGLVSLARVWHNASGFHYSTTMTASKVTLAGTPASLPTPQQPITIPGVGTLAMGDMNRAKDAHHSFARITGLLLTLQPGSANPTVLNLASARAQIEDGVSSGIFQGNAAATKAGLLGGTVTSSGQPLITMPCSGTKGQLQQKTVATAALSSVNAPIDLSAATSQQRANQYHKNGQRYASGFERSWLANVNLGSGALVIKGLQAKVNVTRTGTNFSTVIANANGTGAASITANGSTVPGLSQLNGKQIAVPNGVATIQTSVVEKIKAGKKVIGERVTALRITLLNQTDQTTTVINIGNAELRIKDN